MSLLGRCAVNIYLFLTCRRLVNIAARPIRPWPPISSPVRPTWPPTVCLSFCFSLFFLSLLMNRYLTPLNCVGMDVPLNTIQTFSVFCCLDSEFTHNCRIVRRFKREILSLLFFRPKYTVRNGVSSVLVWFCLDLMSWWWCDQEDVGSGLGWCGAETLSGLWRIRQV